MQCKNHAKAEAVARCAGCAEAFCGDCLVEMQGRKYCGSCKVLALKGMPVLEEATVPCKEAREALICAIIGIFCFSIIVEPFALYRASQAKKMLRMNPRLTGAGKATAATIIAIMGLILWVVGFFAARLAVTG